MWLEGPAFHATGIPEPIVAPAPGHGQHTREIASTLLGLAGSEIDKLLDAGVLEGPLS
jgi:crotonobetainyl-CoA:carnitine CoA-transferase CaiB-like acyl-CoA transferase